MTQDEKEVLLAFVPITVLQGLAFAFSGAGFWVSYQQSSLAGFLASLIVFASFTYEVSRRFAAMLEQALRTSILKEERKAPGNQIIYAMNGMDPENDKPCKPRCEDEYCAGCAMEECPYKEPLHRHHDGCPACYFAEKKA